MRFAASLAHAFLVKIASEDDVVRKVIISDHLHYIFAVTGLLDAPNKCLRNGTHSCYINVNVWVLPDNFRESLEEIVKAFDWVTCLTDED